MNDDTRRGGSEELELDWGGRAPRGSGSEALSPVPLPSVCPVRGHRAPGDPEHMSVEMRFALQSLLEGSRLTIRQALQWPEILVGWETRKRYEVADTTGRPVVYVGESGDGVVSSLLRNFWPFRTIRLEFITLGGTVALAVSRPWRLFLARFDVEAWDGRPL